MSSQLSDLPHEQEAGVRRIAGEDTLERLMRSVTPRMAYAVIALLLVGLGVLASHYYFSVSSELTNVVVTRRVALARLAAATLSERLDRMVDLTVSLATRVRFAELVAARRWEAAAEVLRRVPDEFPLVERVFLADTRGTLMADVPQLAVRGQNFASRDWYRGVSREWKPYVSAVYRRAAAPERNVIAVAAPIHDRASGQVAGILVLQLSLEAFFDWAQRIDLGSAGRLFVVDAQGQAGYASGVPAQAPIVDLSANPAVRKLRLQRSGTEVAWDDPAGTQRLYAFEPAKYGWGVVIEQPAATAFAARELQLRFIQIAYGLLALFLTSAAWLGMRIAGERRRELERVRQSLATHGERLAILREIDRAVAAEQAPEAVAAAVIERLRELLGVPRAIVNKFDLAAGEAEWIAAAGRRRTRVGPGLRYSIGLMGDLEALRRGETQRVEVKALAPGPETQALLASGVHFYMVVPMIAGGELLGALSFGGERAAFPPEQVNIAREVATQLAIAIAQARLLERVKRQAEELERRVQERTAELQAVAETANDAIITADAQARVVYLNRGAERMFGYSREEAQGRPLTCLMPERFRAAHMAGFQRFLATGERHVIGKTVELIGINRNGVEFPIELSLSTWGTGEQRFFTAILRDITARKEIEQRVVERSQQLEAANKELESFSYSVSHDLRAPLRAVDGYALMLEEEYGKQLDDEGRRLLGVVRESSRRMGRLIDDLLAFARLSRQEPAKRAFDMTALAREVLGELSPPQGVAVELAALPPVQADRTLLKQVWLNLIGNALKYSSKRDGARIEIGGQEGAENVYSVRDNGAGFDMRYVGKLFGVFQRLHRSEEFPGTGVGLAIVQRVIARHGGRVWAEGKPGEGACFYFSLPRET